MEKLKQINNYLLVKNLNRYDGIALIMFGIGIGASSLLATAIGIVFTVLSLYEGNIK